MAYWKCAVAFEWKMGQIGSQVSHWAEKEMSWDFLFLDLNSGIFCDYSIHPETSSVERVAWKNCQQFDEFQMFFQQNWYFER